MDLSDVHMETPPASSAFAADPLLTVVVHEDTSRSESVRARLGQSVVKDFGIYRDILEQHVKNPAKTHRQPHHEPNGKV